MGIYLYKGGQQLGPLDETAVIQGVKAGQFSADDMAWKEGLQDWSPLKIVLPQVTAPSAPAKQAALKPILAPAGPSPQKPGSTAVNRPVSGASNNPGAASSAGKSSTSTDKAARPKLTLKKELGANAQAVAAQKAATAAPMLAGTGAGPTPPNEIYSKPAGGPSPVTGFIGAVIGGSIAAAICGILWTVLTTATQREFGIAAWGIGFACGFGVVAASGGGKGPFYQILAVGFSLLGIIIGKYGTFVVFYRQLIEKEDGAEAAAQISFFGPGTILAFIANVGAVFGLFDVLWVFLAMASAWRIANDSAEG